MLRVTSVYASVRRVLPCVSPWRVQAVTCCSTGAINIARARHKMYPASSPIGFCGPHGRTQRFLGLERLPVITSDSACASQTADPVPELREVLLFRACQASIFLGSGTFGASFRALAGPLRELDACRSLRAISFPLLHALPLVLSRCIPHSTVLPVLQNFR